MTPLYVLIGLHVLAQSVGGQGAPAGLKAAVQAYVEKKGDHELPPLRYALSDLDGDGHADAIVLLLGRDWCGSGGCTMLIFRAVNDRFDFVSGSTITGQPIRVSSEKTNGWRTLIVFSKGKGDVTMHFNGKRYPLNPSLQPKAAPAEVSAAQVVIGPTVTQ
jgi:hypothetical protein